MLKHPAGNLGLPQEGSPHVPGRKLSPKQATLLRAKEIKNKFNYLQLAKLVKAVWGCHILLHYI